MKVTLTAKLSGALKDFGRKERVPNTDKLIMIYREGLKKTDWENLEKEDKENTGKYLSSHRLVIGEDLAIELKSFSEKTSLSPGEIFRTALWKGLRHSRTNGYSLSFRETETPITQ
jgi:hypothetical protein